MLEEVKVFYPFLHDCLFDDNLFIFITSFLLLVHTSSSDASKLTPRMKHFESRPVRGGYHGAFYTTFKLAFLLAFFSIRMLRIVKKGSCVCCVLIPRTLLIINYTLLPNEVWSWVILDSKWFNIWKRFFCYTLKNPMIKEPVSVD